MLEPICNDAGASVTPKDILLLTGAGASHHLGLATLDSLLRESYTTTSRPEIAELIWNIRRTIEAGRATSAVFEELIAALKFYTKVADVLQNDHNFRSKLGPLPHEASTGAFKRIWQEALTECYRLLLTEYGPGNIDFKSENFELAINLLRELAAINEGTLHIYTTNYDCTYQVMASHTDRLSFLTHVSNVNGIFSEQWFPARPELGGPDTAQISIHRLHGCVAWFTHESPYCIREIFGAGESLTVEDEGLLHRMCIKLITSQEIGTNMAFLSAFQEFQEHLKSARALLVWGFSFRDLEVLRAINGAYFLRNEPLKIYYLDPFLTEYKLVDNIQKTLSAVPVTIAPGFRPKQIHWLPQHGGDRLIRNTLEALAGEAA